MADTVRFLLLIGRVRCFLHAVILVLIGRQLTAFLSLTRLAPVGEDSIAGTGGYGRIVDNPCGHRDILLANVLAVFRILKAVQIKGIRLSAVGQIPFGNCRAADRSHTCEERRVVSRRHIGEHAALLTADQIELGFVHAEQLAVCGSKCCRVDICNIAIRCAVGFVHVPCDVFRLEEEHNQTFLALLGVRNLAPAAVLEQVISRLAVFAQHKNTGGGFADIMRHIGQHAALFARVLYRQLKRAGELGGIGIFRVAFV